MALAIRQHGSMRKSAKPRDSTCGRPHGTHDDRILDEGYACLARDKRVDATVIEVAVKDDEVTPTGKVRGRRQERAAEDRIEVVLGVRDIQKTRHDFVPRSCEDYFKYRLASVATTKRSSVSALYTVK